MDTLVPAQNQTDTNVVLKTFLYFGTEYNLKLVVVANIQSDVNTKVNRSGGGNDAYPNLY